MIGLSLKECHERMVEQYRQAPERYLRFYQTVQRLCIELPSGCQIKLSDRFMAKALPLAVDIICDWILSVRPSRYAEGNLEVTEGELELLEDGETLRRLPALKRPRIISCRWLK